MSMAAARGWGAASTGVASAGEMLLREMARKKEEELAAEKLALDAELGRGNLSLRGDELRQRGDQFVAGLERDYTLNGFVDAPAEVSPGPRRSLLDPNANLFDGKGIGMAEGSTPGGALLRQITGGGPSASPSAAMPPRKVYSPTADPAEVRAGRERAFEASESAAERAARLMEEREGNAAQVRVAEIYRTPGAGGGPVSREVREANEYSESDAAADAQYILNDPAVGKDINRALARIEGDESPEAQAVRDYLWNLQGEQTRSRMGLGGDTDDLSAGLRSLGIQ